LGEVETLREGLWGYGDLKAIWWIRNLLRPGIWIGNSTWRIHRCDNYNKTAT
jgi:hypothetical protein